MGETDGDVAPADERASQEPSPAPGQDTLQVPTQKKRRIKSPTPLGLRGRSATPIRGRSQTPFTLYLTRRSATPSTWRSITPFLKREDKEKTPFELGRDIKTQLYCNKAVFDKALIMDITEPEVPPVRYITSDMSVIDRAAVMDVSNVEVIYVVEEYDDYTEEEEEEVIVEVKPKKKEKKGKKGRTPRRSADKEESPGDASESRGESEGPDSGDREESVEPDAGEKKSKKKTVTKKKEKKEKSPSPKISLKLELGGGPKASKKMFDQAPPQPPPQAARPPPKKSKLALQLEEQAKAAKAAAEEQAKRDAEKQKTETFEERQKRLKAEAEEQARIEAEIRAQQEAEEAELAAMEHEEEGSGDEEGSEAGHTGYETGDGDTHDEDEYGEDEDAEAAEEGDEFEEHGKDERRASKASVDSFTRPDPDDEEKWKKIAEEEGEEFMLQLRKYSRAQARSERERDADWQKRREQARLPHFINFLTDRTVEAGNNVRLACAVGGPELSVKWFKDGKQLERDATHRIANNNNILTLEVVKTVPTDSGEYSCVIANMNDEVTSSCIVTIYEVFKGEPSPPTFSLIRDFYHLHDDELTIECHVHGMPRPKISWWFGAFEIKASYKFTLLEEAHGVYKLLIFRPSNKDSGKYICKAVNSSGEAQIAHAIEVAKNKNFHVHGIFHARDRFSRERESIARQAMEEAIASKKESDRRRAATEEPRGPRTSSANEPIVSPKNKLKIATQLRDRMALEGATIKLFCNVLGPDPACRWMKDDKFIAVGPNIRNLTEEGRAVLELIKVTSEASGQYKLVAKNEHSQVDTSCYLKVYSTQVEGDEQEPMFALPIRDVYHSSENDLIIDTKVRGNPRPTISWFKDSQPVVVDDRIQQIEHLDGICELIINKPTPKDSGEYSCEATNSLGSSKINHSVVVDQLPASRRSSASTSTMGEDKDGAAGGKQREGGDADTSRRPPKGKKKASDEGEATYERRSRMPDPSPKMSLYFIGNISNRYLAEGNRVKLQAVIGGPDPTIKWLKDGQNVAYGPRVRNLSRDGLAVLEFTKTEVGDSGTYTVIARNEACEINSTALLHVYQPKVNSDIEPVFIRSLKETYHLNTNELILETGARGQPTPTISWFKDSVEIENGDRFQIINHPDGTSELIIDRPTDKDSGKYVVKAENRAGKSEIAHHVLFEGKETHIAENIHGVFHADKNLLRKGHKEEERPPSAAATDSEAEGEEGKGKGKKGKKGKKKEEEEEVIEIPDVPVKEQKREKHIGIHFKAKATDRVVAEGSRVKLTAYLEGNEPQVRWFRNDEPIAFGPKVRHSYREGLCTLELVSANVNDSGQYKCVARDGTGEVTTACKLEVYARPDNADVPPTFTRSIKDAYHGKVNEIVLDVHVRGLPTPTITWVKDGVKIEPSDKYQQIDHPDGTCELFISSPVPGDSGKYVCQAENRKDKAEITHLVHIEIQKKRAVSPGREIPKLPPSAASAEESAEEKEKKKKKKKDDGEGESSSRREVPPPPDLRKRVYLRNYLSNRTVPSGSNVRWVINIDGPDPTARWYRNEQMIAFGPKSKLACQDGIAYLQLVGVTEEDAGEIKLVVKGSENEVQSTCTLFVYNTAKVEEVAPVFTVGIKDTYQSQTNQIILECKVSGNPKPNIFWQKDNLLLEFPSDKYQLVELPEGIKQLIIAGPSDEDTGLYTCYAESVGGQMKLSKFLDVTDHVKQKREQRKPQDIDGEKVVDLQEEKEKTVKTREAKRKLVVEAIMKSMTLGSGNKAQLLCNVSGPIDEVQWYKNGQRVFKDSKHKIYNINGTLSLEIYDASPDDSGEYTCIAKNAQHQAENKCSLSIYDSRTGFKAPESFASAIRESFDAHRNEVVLECNVHGRPRVTWLKDDHLISNNRYRQIEEIGGLRRLVIRNPISSDFGSFACYAETDDRIEAIAVTLKAADLKKIMTVTNGHATDSRSDDSYKHHRSSTRDQEEEYSHGRSTARDGSYSSEHKRKPVFSMLLNDRTVSECSNLRLTCNVVGECEITWLKNHNPLPANSRYQKYFSNGTATLEIFSAQVEDSGSYTCRANNEYGETFSYAQVKVYQSYEDAPQPPTFIRYMKDTYSLNENELVLDCRVRGKPRPEIQWMKDSDMIYTDDKYRTIDQADGYCKLIVNSPTEKDAGLYSCIARNTVHEEKITHQVDFQGRDRFILEKTHGFFHRDPNKPHFTSPLGNQTVSPGGTIAIQAEFLPTSTPIDVQWFRDKQSLAGQPNVRTFLDHGVYTLAIQNAAQEWEGTYTCRASNAFGRIESHINVDIAAKGGKTAGPPLFLSRPETEMKIAVGDPFSISFRLQGEPKPKLTLLKGTRDITKSDRVSKEASDDYIRFTVQKSQVADSGTYFVVARNEFGTDRVFVTITVLQRARSATPTSPRWGLPLDSFPDTSYFRDPPGPISTEPTVIDAGKSHISLSWGKPQGGNSAPVIAYRVDAWIVGKEGGAMWKEIGMTPINSFDAFNLLPNCEYHFRVTPKNRYGWGPSVQTRSPVQVGGAECLPEFVKILPGQTKALLGKECSLECVVQGAPRPKIIWYKDGLQIESTERVRIKQFGSVCTLHISQIFDVDSGRYTCEATNSKGRVSTFARLQVVSDEKLYAADHKLKELVTSENGAPLGETIPIFTMRLRDRRVQVTYPVRLTCQVMGYPRPEITWYKNDEVVEHSRTTVISDDGQFNTLEITSTKLDDSGIYTCTARNELGSVSCHCSLIVDKGIRAYISPDFYMPLEPFYIFREGQEIRLTAKVEAYPSVGVSWHRNGVKLRPSRRILATLDCNGFVELIIAEATQRDAGIYVCVASNAVGKVETSTRVTVEEVTEVERKKLPAIRTGNLPYSKEPLFVVKPRSSEAYEGDTVIIFCEVIGDPKPDVVWLRDFLKPEYYKDAPHFRRIGDGPEYRLEIPSAKLDFTGTYSVIASNCHGQTQAIISLQIFAKDINKLSSMEKGSIRHGNVETLPFFISPLKDLRCCDGDAVTLECHVEAVPEPAIIWEKDGHVLHSGKDFDMVYDGIKAILSIRRIFSEDEGEYTCVAKNNVGRALSSACIIVDVPEEKENLLTRQLARPSGLLSACSTPRSTPRTTPNRSVSPLRLSFRHTSIDLTTSRRAVAAPKFYAIPHNKVVEEGDSVRFQCAITGHPTPWSTWDKDGLIVTPTTRISVKEIEDLRMLEIDEVTFDDAGLYRITLENDYGRIEATARLDVIGSSKYSRSPAGRAVRSSSSRRNFFISRRIMGPSTRIGGRMALSTGMRGSSVPARKFYHNGDEVVESERIQISLTDSEAFLIVDNVTEADEGIYTCIAEDEHGVQATSTSVVFYTDDVDIPCDPPKIVSPLPKTVEAYEGQITDLAFELECFEPYSYVWTRNGEVLPDSSEFKYIDHGNGIICLRIQDTFDLDTGLYECIVTSVYGTCTTTCELQVDDRHPAVNSDDVDRSGLAILKHPLPVIGIEGMITSFCAKVYPSNAHSSWTVCGRDVTADSRNFSLEESHSDGVRILHVLGLDYSHSGEVQFTVRSPIRPKTERITTYTSLAVLPGLPRAHFQIERPAIEEVSAVPAYINQGPADCTALIGETVRLRVTYGGYPVPVVKWFKAGRPITEGSNTRVCTIPGQSTLELTSIIADASGKYTVEIMNDHGSDFAAASVAVEGPPEPPSGKPSISQGPDRVAVAWCGPPYDGGCMLTGFIIEMQNESDGEWREIATVVDSLAYTVKHLTPHSAYRFRVRAENIHGRSEPGFASDRVEISDPEVSSEDFQRTISIKSGGDFKSRFEILEELGKGRFGVVYKVQEKDTSQTLAAKVIKCIKSRDRQKVQEEISIMQSLQHPKLLQLAASFESAREIVMVMEYITGGELFERVVADDFTLTERDCILFLRQVCEGVDYMHSQSIVHLDLKPENIMCHTRTSHQIKIIDFGLAQRLNSDSPVRVLFGTPEFIPPEIINYEPISFQSDMWSVGVICYVLLSGLSPFMGDSDADTFNNITRADYDFEDEAFDAVSQEAKDFISNLLVHRKEDRLTAKQCLESTWLTQHHDENLSNNKICTDKLKKFIIRRKWQKTGNAIRALGRMANLSASRRNSAVSAAGSLPSSPRPSVSGASIFNPNISAHMTSLNEEEDDFNPDLPSLELKLNVRNSLKVRDKTQCSERSDSGFSECSTCSGGVNGQCHCPNPVVDKPHMPPKDTEEEHSPLSVAVPHDILKTKLEEIAKSQLVEHDGSETKPMDTELWEEKTHPNQDESLSPRPRSPGLDFNLEHKNVTMATETVPIMRSDFTNTIKMRKKSLENNLAKEKIKPPKVILETSGKVSMLKNKFSQVPPKSVSSPFECKANPKPSMDLNKPRNVFDRLTSCNKSNTASKTSASISLPSSPLPVRSASTMRLSGRIREATERLSQPKTPQAPRKFTNTLITTTGSDITLKKSNSDHHQTKNLKTFRGLS